MARLVDEEVHRRRTSFKEVVNDAIRRGLSPRVTKTRAPRYQVAVHQTALKPGLDRAALNRLADELEDDATFGKRG